MIPAMPSPWRDFWTFFGLAILLLGLVPVSSAVLGTSMDFGAIAARASEQTGVAWTSNLVSVIRLSLAEPGLWLLVLGSAVPTLAALCALGLRGDRAQWSDLAGRLRPFGPRGSSAGSALLSYLVLTVAIVACLFAAFALRGIVSPGEYERSIDVVSSGFVFAVLGAAFLDQGAVLEEAGWRGYATPLLQRSLTPLAAAVIVGVAWSLWHVPRDVVSGTIERLGPAVYLLLFLPAFTLGGVAVSIVASYFMNRAGGSLLPAIMVHGLANDAMGIAGAATIERALTPGHQITKALPFALLALLIWRIAGSRLGHGDQPGSA
jgi:membrane protease YdiL (CAAX protease family)